jgi:ABC-type transporter Mla MlaB component
MATASEDTGFTYLVERSPDEVRLVGRGTLDLASKGALPIAIDELLGDDLRGRTVTLDLCEVFTIDSTGLSDLVVALRRCDDFAAAWRLIPSAAVRRLLALVGVGRLRSDSYGGWLTSGGYQES